MFGRRLRARWLIRAPFARNSEAGLDAGCGPCLHARIAASVAHHPLGMKDQRDRAPAPRNRQRTNARPARATSEPLPSGPLRAGAFFRVVPVQRAQHPQAHGENAQLPEWVRRRPTATTRVRRRGRHRSAVRRERGGGTAADVIVGAALGLSAATRHRDRDCLELGLLGGARVLEPGRRDRSLVDVS